MKRRAPSRRRGRLSWLFVALFLALMPLPSDELSGASFRRPSPPSRMTSGVELSAASPLSGPLAADEYEPSFEESLDECCGGDDVFLDDELTIFPAARAGSASAWSWRLFPTETIYSSYLAGAKEPRFAAHWRRDLQRGWLLDGTVGGRMGLVRWGNAGGDFPQGWQLDVEGAAFPRLDMEDHGDMDAADFRVGVPLTFGIGRWQTKLAAYHLSSHLADEFMLKNPSHPRLNFSRDVLVWGNSFYPIDDLRLYAEVGWGVETDGGSEPWEFQFGADYSPRGVFGPGGAPFLALNGHLRQELDFGGNFVAQFGWQWRSAPGSRLLRVGGEYYNGASSQYQFFHRHEQQLGLGMWYDF